MACNVAACQHEPTANIKMKEKANWMAKSTRTATKHERIRDIQKVWPHTYQLCITLICIFTAFFTRMYCIECQTRYKTLILQYIRFHTTKTHKHTAQLYRGGGSNGQQQTCKRSRIEKCQRRQKKRARAHQRSAKDIGIPLILGKSIGWRSQCFLFILFVYLLACFLFKSSDMRFSSVHLLSSSLLLQLLCRGILGIEWTTDLPKQWTWIYLGFELDCVCAFFYSSFQFW